MRMNYYYAPYNRGGKIDSELGIIGLPLGDLKILPASQPAPTRSSSYTQYRKISKAQAIAAYGRAYIDRARKNRINLFS